MNQIDFWVQIVVNEGAAERFQQLAADTVDAVKLEAGCLRYQWYFSEDERTCHLHESYMDTGALLAHLQGKAVTTMQEQFIELAHTTSVSVHCDLEDLPRDTASVLAGLGAAFYQPIVGFCR